jgi:uncharacterized protein
MSKFLAVFLSVYSLMHLLFFLRIRILLPSRTGRWIVALFLLIMILAPLMSRILERQGYDLPAHITAFAGFYWMGFIFIGFVAAVLMGGIDIFSYGIGQLTAFIRDTPPACSYILSGKTPVIVMLASVIAVCIYGIIEARHPRIEYLHLVTHKLPTGTGHLRIVHISDMHLGMLTGSKRIKGIADKIKSLNPDILVCTGDMVDVSDHHLKGLSDIFNEIRPRYGKYAVTGNHEYYAGIENSLKFMQDCGFTVLRGKAETVQSLINIVGVDDSVIGGTIRESVLLSSSAKNGLFTLFLKHRPIVRPETLGLFDLQLSGHTHGGQIFPFRFIVSVPFPFLRGYYVLPKGSGIYVNRGTGTWGPQMRVLSPPEITVIELERG